MIPCVLFEDEHLLAVNKPPGMNTHAPGPYANEGIYDWLRHREPGWSRLAIIHRLDKETSGVIVFAKTSLASRSLTDQFTRRVVRKKYLLLSAHSLKRDKLIVKSKIARAGERYVSGNLGEPAETRFRSLDLKSPVSESNFIEAEPLTGRTHQIRVHAADNGIPVLGDTLYGGAPFQRVCLHAAEIALRHPATGEEITFRAPADFSADARASLRSAVIDPDESNAFRRIHGGSDGWPGWYVEQLDHCWLSQFAEPLAGPQHKFIQDLAGPAATVYHKILNRQVRRTNAAESSPQIVSGKPAPANFAIRENGLQFELRFTEGYSVGLFLDQRENRRRLLTGHVAADFSLPTRTSAAPNCRPEVLNTFAYTCAFSVCAAKAGARTTSLDLSKKYLDWGRRNFALNKLDPGEHDFIYGDVFTWMRRLARKGRRFDVILLDPPTFSQSKEHGVFRAEKDYAKLVAAALPLLKPNGVLFASTNAANWPPENFLEKIKSAFHSAKREIVKQHYVPQPPDFPISRSEPAYLKTVWLKVG